MRLILLLLVCCLFTSASVRGFSQLTILTEEFPPYNFQQGEFIKGINIEVVKQACLQADIMCDFELYPWKRAMTLAQKHDNSGLVSTSRTPNRETLFHWVGPLVSGPACFYKLASRGDIKVNSRDDLLNYTIGLPWADVYEETLKRWGFKAGENYVTYYKKFGYVKAFKMNKLDLFIASSNTLASHLERLNVSVEQVEPVLKMYDPTLKGNFLALNLNVSKETVRRLQSEVTEIMASSNLDVIKRRYIKVPKFVEQHESDLFKRCML